MAACVSVSWLPLTVPDRHSFWDLLVVLVAESSAWCGTNGDQNTTRGCEKDSPCRHQERSQRFSRGDVLMAFVTKVITSA